MLHEVSALEKKCFFKTELQSRNCSGHPLVFNDSSFSRMKVPPGSPQGGRRQQPHLVCPEIFKRFVTLDTLGWSGASTTNSIIPGPPHTGLPDLQRHLTLNPLVKSIVMFLSSPKMKSIDSVTTNTCSLETILNTLP